MKICALWLIAALAACSEPGAGNEAGNSLARESAEQNDIAGSSAAEDKAGMAGGGNEAVHDDRDESNPDRSVSRNVSAADPQPPRPADSSGDQCRSRAYQYLVGRHRREIPSRLAGETWRVTCTTCPVTMDYSPQRLNIFYDERTEIVEQVRCG